MIWNSCIDIRKRKISVKSCALMAVLRVMLLIGEPDGMIKDLFAGSIPGLVLLGLCLVSRKSLGGGDGLVVLVSGWYLGLAVTVEGLFWGLIASSVFGLVLLMKKKIRRDTELPFLPFLFLGMLGAILLSSR